MIQIISMINYCLFFSCPGLACLGSWPGTPCQGVLPRLGWFHSERLRGGATMRARREDMWEDVRRREKRRGARGRPWWAWSLEPWSDWSFILLGPACIFHFFSSSSETPKTLLWISAKSFYSAMQCNDRWWTGGGPVVNCCLFHSSIPRHLAIGIDYVTRYGLRVTTYTYDIIAFGSRCFCSLVGLHPFSFFLFLYFFFLFGCWCRMDGRGWWRMIPSSQPRHWFDSGCTTSCG